MYSRNKNQKYPSSPHTTQPYSPPYSASQGFYRGVGGGGGGGGLNAPLIGMSSPPQYVSGMGGGGLKHLHGYVERTSPSLQAVQVFVFMFLICNKNYYYYCHYYICYCYSRPFHHMV
jgi:hypothetical protein